MTNWAGSLVYGASDFAEPRSLDELQNLVCSSAKLKALGSRHSFNRLADTSGTHVSFRHFSSISDVNVESSTVRVGAGVRYGELAPALQSQGFALKNMASLPHISVAGAVATATHGSGARNQNLSATVSELEMVNGSGEVTVLRRGEPDFLGAVVGLGALGMVTSLSLDVTPSFDLEQQVYDGLSFDQFFDSFATIMESGYSVSLFTDWSNETSNQLWIKDSAGRDWPPEVRGAVRARAPRHPVPGMPPENCTEQLGKAGHWNDRLPHFKLEFTPSSGEELQSEYLFDRADAYLAMKAVRAIANSISPLLFVSEVRTIAADDLWLSPSYGRDSVAIHFTWKQLPELVMPAIVEVERALEPFSARPHWGKLFAMKRERLAPLYPHFDDFIDLAQRSDASGKFRNAFLNEAIFEG